jgi:hypothetical protein
MQKIKSFINSEAGKDILVVIIVILVGLGSFQLGRLSAKEAKTSGVKIEYLDEKSGQYVDQTANVISASQSINNKNSTATSQNSDGKNYFASSRGSKYYTLGCSAGKSIKMENRVYFETSEEAESAGYERSGSCK